MIDIAAGSAHSAAIVSEGDLYSWGFGEYGRLGHGDAETQIKPKMVKSFNCILHLFFLFVSSLLLQSGSCALTVGPIVRKDSVGNRLLKKTLGIFNSFIQTIN